MYLYAKANQLLCNCFSSLLKQLKIFHQIGCQAHNKSKKFQSIVLYFIKNRNIFRKFLP